MSAATDPIEGRTVRETDRWRGVTALAFAAGAVGVLSSRPAALLVGVVGVAFAAYARASTPPVPAVTVERDLSTTRADPGDAVEVTLSVRNDGPDLLADVRVVDGVPPGLAVVDGSPRLATALRPGKRATVTYAVEATRGHHAFEDARVLVRDLAGATETEVAAGDDAALDCVPALDAMGAAFPLRDQTARYAGRVTTDHGGSGVEFHSTREYRTGDPLARVDWSRLARRGDLTTVDFREERAATVVVVVDARESAYATDADEVPAVEYGVDAAGQVAAALLSTGDRVGVASLGPAWSWLAPGLGRVHRTRLREALALDPGFAPVPAGRQFLPGLALRRLRKHLPPDAQVVFCSPVLDDYAARAVRRLEALGHAVTVLSPDVTGEGTPGQRLAGVERADRLRELRSVGVRVLDWDPDRPLAAAVADARRGWLR